MLVESREASPSVAVGILQLLLSLLDQMKLHQLRLPPPPRPGPSSRPAPRHSPQPGPSSQRNQRFASQDRSRPRDTSSDRSHDRGISEDRSRKRFASSDRTGHRRRFSSGDSPSPKRRRSSSASSDDECFGESPSRSSPALMIPPSLPPFGGWWISFSRPFQSIRLLLPIHCRDHSIYLLLRTWPKRFPQVRFCLGLISKYKPVYSRSLPPPHGS